jgi:predicted nucleic-acid-binding protein
MIGLDSNALVRYLTQDDPVQSRKADQIIDQALQSEEPLYLNHVVLCEVNWVLGRAYSYGLVELGDTLEKILSSAQFEFEDKNCLWQALAAFPRIQRRLRDRREERQFGMHGNPDVRQARRHPSTVLLDSRRNDGLPNP